MSFDDPPVSSHQSTPPMTPQYSAYNQYQSSRTSHLGTSNTNKGTASDPFGPDSDSCEHYGASSTSPIEDTNQETLPRSSIPPTPLPRAQIAILQFLLLTEPVSGFVIYPFVTKLVVELGITNGNKSTVGYYVGFIESLFYVAQGLTVLQWGRFSDSLGRRPVILLGIFGLAFSLLAFGFTTTTTSSTSENFSPWASFGWVVFSRSLAGFLDGNVGVLKTMMAELTDESNRARAFGLLSSTWVIGSTIAPLMGGALEHPAERFPAVFGPKRTRIWVTYPYLLPCLAASIFCFIMAVVGYVFLKETRAFIYSPPSKMTRSDYEPIPQDSFIERNDPTTPLLGRKPTKNKQSLREVLIRPVLISILNYGCLAILEISYFSIMTVFFAVPISSGGLGFSPPLIGVIFSTLGLVSGFVQLFLFPAIHKKFGAKRVLQLSVASFLVVFPMFVTMHLAAQLNQSTSTITKDSTGGGEAKGILVWIGIMCLVCINSLIDMGYGK
ncbi:MFS general substrate transporter [Clavulina sp. PMI_390]|nr:MFS general substrate transporter [Clavulina sp. PMI_390]